MKLSKYFLLVTTGFVPIMLASIFVLSSSGDKFLQPTEAQKKWGSVEFDANQFKSGNAQVRASMAASLVSTKALIGMPLASVREKLGPSTGYYFSDLIPAFAIGDLSHGRSETWQIVLIPDDVSKVIKEVKIHKKCCKK